MTKMIGRRVVLMGSALAVAPLAARAEMDTLAKAKAAGVLVVGNGGAFPPFEFVRDGMLGGFDIDMGNEIGRRMGLRIDWKVIDFAGLIASLTSGRVDALITAMTWTPERAARMAFSTPYYKTGIAAAYRADLDVSKPDDLAGKIVGVQAGTAGEKFVRDNYASTVKALRTYNEFPLALSDLEIGRTQVVVNTLPVLRYNLARDPHAKLRVSEVWDARDVGINTRPADTTLLAEINRHLAMMQADGFLAKLNTQWFGAAS
jgi:ABC-type amino acid transport substrate-binding protein